METIRTITRWVPQYGFAEPGAYETTIRLNRGNTGTVCIMTDWACLPGTLDSSDAQMIAALGQSFDTEADATLASHAARPYWAHPKIELIREYLLRVRYTDGVMMGNVRAADKFGVCENRIVDVAQGRVKPSTLPRLNPCPV